MHGEVYEQVCLYVLLTSDLIWSKHMYIEAVETLDIGCNKLHRLIMIYLNYVRLVAMLQLVLITVFLSVPSNVQTMSYYNSSHTQYDIDCSSNAAKYLFGSCMSADNYTRYINKKQLEALTTLSTLL